MVATAPTKSLPAFRLAPGAGDAPDLAHFRRRYPETVANFGALPRREEWLRRIWALETAWRADWETRGGAPLAADSFEAVVRGALERTICRGDGLPGECSRSPRARSSPSRRRGMLREKCYLAGTLWRVSRASAKSTR